MTVNFLPADVITSLPNANVADAIGRLAGVTLERDEGEGKYVKVRGTEPRLTHTTLDGVNIASPETVRQIKLDLIPADSGYRWTTVWRTHRDRSIHLQL